MSKTPIEIEWKSSQHRWATVRIYRDGADPVSQHDNPRAAILQSQKWFMGDPYTIPEDNILSHWYDVVARDDLAAFTLAFERNRITCEDAGAGRAYRFLGPLDPNGEVMHPGIDDQP